MNARNLIIPIDSLDDPRLDPYRNLKERELARRGGRFIAEGEHLLQRLMDSDFPVESVLLSDRRASEMTPFVRAGVPIYVLPQSLMEQVLGFKFHSGVIACGVRKPSPRVDQVIHPTGQATLVVLPEIANVENIGSLVRISAAFGVDAMILGERCHDPFFRQSVRVSMGAVFKLPLVRATDLKSDLNALRAQGFELIATVLDPAAEPLPKVRRAVRTAILFGNEAQGLEPEWQSLCTRRVTIPMHLGTDSLNVAVAAGIFLYHFTDTADVRATSTQVTASQPNSSVGPQIMEKRERKRVQNSQDPGKNA